MFRKRTWLPTVYTFAAVFLTILAVGAVVVPAILVFAQRGYLDLVTEVNERQARAMTAFLEARLADGLNQEQAIREFQAATAGSDVARGYVCLIEQDSARYLSHPDLAQLGMNVKPGAVFDPAGVPPSAPWNSFLRRGATADGRLSYGPQMAQEMVYFTPVANTGWILSTHENLTRIETELEQLRRWLLAGAVLLSLIVALPTSIAARAVSRRRERQIERHAELERQLLAAADARKAQELERARDLQLSLLPHKLPCTPELKIAARMETAAEVGGDFYDAREREDGSVLLVIGDATGHGLSSGMVVVAVKALIAFFFDHADLVAATRSIARALRRMRFGRLSMALALVRLDGYRMEAVGAGMPPALVHRWGSDEVEEFPLSGVPLGSPIEFPYALRQTELGVGDTVLLMSDGLPELRCNGSEELGYEGVKRLFRSALRAADAPREIAAAVVQGARAESGCELDDDMTILVLKVER